MRKDDNNLTDEQIRGDLRYLQLLAQSYPTITEASTEIINLEAILNLPKPTEHFISDPHGESDAFNHVLKNASGYIKRKIKEVLGDSITKTERRDLCTLIYYPEQKIHIIKTQLSGNKLDEFYAKTLIRLVQVCRVTSEKYTRSKIRKALPKHFEYIIEELLHESDEGKKQKYYQRIIDSIIDTGQAESFIIAISKVIQRFAIDHLHILGDIYDRGNGAHLIVDTLCNFHNFDIVWGNHDIEWFGAAAGNKACICNVLRIALRYGNLITLEDGYGINLLPLATFAMETYKDDPCEQFQIVKVNDAGQNNHETKMERLIAQMHKAISVIQFKVEAEIIDRRPEFGMEDRKMLHLIDFRTSHISIGKKKYKMTDINFPTVNPNKPYELTSEEEDVIERLQHSFCTSEELRRHVQCLLSHGSIYNISNGNLMFHASVPLNEDGTMKEITIGGRRYYGIGLMKKINEIVHGAFQNDFDQEQKLFDIDYLWYLWCGKDSPLYDKDKMTTFERYFIKDKSAHAEVKGYYYQYSDNENVMNSILDAFGVKGKNRHIINGHVPVRIIKGEKPVKANGRHLVIDGGFSLAYQPKTGIAGYTLVYHSRGLELVQHQPFLSAEEAIKKGEDIKSSTQIIEMSEGRIYVKDTDKGRQLMSNVENLRKLLYAYRHGLIKQNLK